MRKIIKYIDSIKSSIEFRVGQNAQENFDLLDDSFPQDLWFHISEESSCHVVATIPTDSNYDRKGMKKIAIQGAIVCKQHCRYKSEKDIRVVYTTIDNVKKSKYVGMVSVDNYKTIVV